MQRLADLYWAHLPDDLKAFLDHCLIVLAAHNPSDQGPPQHWLEHLQGLAQARSVTNASGLALRPVHQQQALGAQHYEQHIFNTGEILCRTHEPAAAWHDLMNGLQWLCFPKSKATLNALQVQAIARQQGTTRSAQRDWLTLLDEGAVIWIGDWALIDSLRQQHWQTLLVNHRKQLQSSVCLLPFGHAFQQKLLWPYKAITAWVIPLALEKDADIAQVDEALARWLSDLDASGPRPFYPLPVMGWPGWCKDNEQPDFYQDKAVFRSA
jgi:Protein of unknown function (DUF3025)